MFTDLTTNVTYAHVSAYAVPIGTEMLHKGNRVVFEAHWPEFKVLRPLDSPLENPDPTATIVQR